MITITNDFDCCGCNACAQRCPKNSITLVADTEGFLYPKINAESCIDCGLCEKVCPVINSNNQSQKPFKVIAAINPNENIRKNSSSGGIFTLLAEQIIKDHGVVFGAKFDKNWQVIHDYAETTDELAKFRGSKYVQSKIGNNFILAEKFLKEGRKVLFSGTPCQIAGLKLFLRKEYTNLFTIDIICHGVPSPKIWDLYLKTICKNTKDIETINFRNKVSGWKNYSFHVEFKAKNFSKGKGAITPINQIFHNNIFMKGFLANIYLRPSCYKCPCKPGKSRSDITIGDYWGGNIQNPEMDDDKGTSIILYHSTKFSSFNFTQSKEIPYQTVLKYNPSIEYDTHPHIKRDFFFQRVNENNLNSFIQELTKPSLKQRFINNRIIRKIKSLYKKHRIHSKGNCLAIM